MNDKSVHIPWKVAASAMFTIIVALISYIFVSYVSRADAQNAQQDTNIQSLFKISTENTTNINNLLKLSDIGRKQSKIQAIK